MTVGFSPPTTKQGEQRKQQARLICLVEHTEIWEHKGLKQSDGDAQTAAAALFITAAEENVARFIFFNHSDVSKKPKKLRFI